MPLCALYMLAMKLSTVQKLFGMRQLFQVIILGGCAWLCGRWCAAALTTETRS